MLSYLSNIYEIMADKPEKLYHGSGQKIIGELAPILKHGSPEHIHSRPAVFGTARKDLAALFMFSPTFIYSIGFEQDIAYVCIWGTSEEFKTIDQKGFIYVLPGDTFEKVGKDYEWQSFEAVKPIEVLEFNSALVGMMECGVQVYFINDDPTMDKVVADKNNRSPILRELVSENQKQNFNVKEF